MFALEQLLVAEESILQEIYEIEDPRLELLESIPSIGPITSRVLFSGLDNVDRFDDKKSVAKYGALTPRIYQSGNKSITSRLSNDGRKEMRRCL
jgi:transposase